MSSVKTITTSKGTIKMPEDFVGFSTKIKSRLNKDIDKALDKSKSHINDNVNKHLDKVPEDKTMSLDGCSSEGEVIRKLDSFLESRNIHAEDLSAHLESSNTESIDDLKNTFSEIYGDALSDIDLGLSHFSKLTTSEKVGILIISGFVAGCVFTGIYVFDPYQLKTFIKVNKDLAALIDYHDVDTKGTLGALTNLTLGEDFRTISTTEKITEKLKTCTSNILQKGTLVPINSVYSLLTWNNFVSAGGVSGLSYIIAQATGINALGQAKTIIKVAKNTYNFFGGKKKDNKPEELVETDFSD